MDDPAQVGHCVNCGAFAYAQSLCDPCSEKEESEDATLYRCPECKSKYSDIKGQPCKHCQEEAHEDGKCFDKCYQCESRILRGDCR
jgi:Zn finger protein HypA/HybF involved in hydrogenase expression